MRQHLAFLALGLFGGCSLIFNPDNIHKPIDAKDFQDVPLDVEVIADADLSMPELSEVYPATVYEGVGVTETGTGVGTPAVLVLRGHNFAKDPSDHLVVTLTPDSGGMLVIDDTQIARDGNFIALAVTSPIDAACHDGGSHNVTISVQQDNGTGGTAMAPPLVGALTITCLDELTASPASASALKPRYSKVDITGNLTFPPNESPNTTAIVQSMSFIKVTGNVTADASAAGPGPGGCAGGTAGATLGGPGGPGACAGGGGGGTGSGGGGGGGGFTAAGSGGAGSTAGGGGAMQGTLYVPTIVSGGGGGGGGGGTLAAGAVGGASGGNLVLTAHGKIDITGSISAGGAVGASTTQVAAGGGGGGSGGLIVVRAYDTATIGSLSVTNGGGGTGTGLGGAAGGAGAAGRTRVDAPNPTNTGLASPGYRGPMFVAVPTSVTTQTPMVSLISGPSFDMASGIAIDRNNQVTPFPAMITFSTTMPSTATAMPTLTSGYNQLCVIVTGGLAVNDIAKNCVEIAFLPGGP